MAVVSLRLRASASSRFELADAGVAGTKCKDGSGKEAAAVKERIRDGSQYSLGNEPTANALSLTDIISEHAEAAGYTEQFSAAFADVNPWLLSELIDQVLTLNVPLQKFVIGEAILERLCPPTQAASSTFLMLPASRQVNAHQPIT